ncbi:MAG TPA: UDP-N-acetylmuramoyl-L-alanine--D-glutamate ligase [Bacteroidota bacterium]|nr:UDP-N-acetylmuramoyl-L-alanine--D-glutamate ligase [Bacteroidota bacterium]
MDGSRIDRKDVSVIGAARSGVGVARLLKHHGARVFVSDAGDAQKLRQSIAEFEKHRIEFETGRHSDRVFQCSLMVLSPGVPSDAPVVREALKRSISVVSELEVASWFCKAPIVAITGSNGKTTTTTLAGRIFGDAKKKHVVAGNIGEAFSNFVLDLVETDVVVLEVSSFQLDFIESFRPAVSVILNITRNHMDRYGNSMERYADSKARIFMNQTANDILIYNADDPLTAARAARAKAHAIPFSTARELPEGAFLRGGFLTTRLGGKESSVVEASRISIKGEHNLQNAMAAALIGECMGVGAASMRSTLKNFKGVEHRQEFVREVGGVKYVNDSKATTVEAVSRALAAYDEPIVLILGGKDKGNDYTQVFDTVKKKVKAIVAVGASASTVVKNFSGLVRVERVDTIGTEIPNVLSMSKTVATAKSLARRGDVVLLSPACTSFDWFTDYEERGKVYKSIVNALDA